MSLDPVKNFSVVTVSTGYDASATTVVLASNEGAKLPATHNYNLVWFNFTDYKNPSDDPNIEIVRVTARTTDTLTVTRAQEGTSAATHNTGGKVYHMTLGITAKMITDIDTARTIASAEVTLAMMANLAQDTFIGRVSASAGVPEALSLAEQTVLGRITDGHIVGLTAAQIRTLINVADGANNYVLADKAVTLAKMDDMATASLIYRKTASAGVPEVNTLATLKTDLGLTGSNGGDQSIASLGLDADLATLALPANTTITAAGAELINDADAAAQLATLGAVATGDARLSDARTPVAHNQNLSTITDVTATAAELNYTDGVTSGIQTQFTGKKTDNVSANNKILGRVTAGAGAIEEIACTPAGRTLIGDSSATAQLADLLGVPSATAAELNVLDGITATVTELNYTDGVTSAIQGQVDAKAPLAPTGATYTPATGAQTVALNVATVNMHVVSGHASGTAITFTVANAANNQPFVVSILQGGTTVSTITAWFATVRWAGGTAPTLTATLNKRDTFGFIRTGANTYDGFVIGQNA